MKMIKRKVGNPNRIFSDWCKKHPDCFEATCKSCHQSALDGIEIKLMDLHEEVKNLLGEAKWHYEKGATSSWGWSHSNFMVKR